MRLAEQYQVIPRGLRKLFIDKVINWLPTSELRRSRSRDLKRFLQSATQPQLERYLNWMSALKPEMKSQVYTEQFLKETTDYQASGALNRYFDKAANYGLVDKLLFLDQQTYLPNDLLVKVDIASMAVSLEARSPFLDHKLIEFAASLPESLKLRGTTTKYILKKVAAKLVPREVIYRPKMGFSVPLGHWFRGDLTGFIREILLSEKSQKRGLFKPEAVVRMVETHISGERDYATQLWALLMLELWFQKFID
jgi:asparagine synthase (glutamine-hydrolysing)